jgi:hypothetical protein
MTLYQQWLDAKAAEKAATAVRIAVEDQILMQHPPPEEGQNTFDEDGFKVVVKQEINRKLDDKAWEMVRDQIPEKLRPIEYVESLKLDVKGLRWLRENEPGFYKLVAQCVTEKPSKPNIKIERISQ